MRKIFYKVPITACAIALLSYSLPVWSLSSTWLGGSSADDMKIAANWSAGTPGAADTGVFVNVGADEPNLMTLTLNTGSFSFAANSKAYLFTISGPTIQLNFFQTAGVTNQSGVVQNFFVNTNGLISFANNTAPVSNAATNYNIGTGIGAIPATAGTISFVGNFTDTTAQVSLANGSLFNLDGGAGSTVTVGALTSDALSTVNLYGGDLIVDYSEVAPINIQGPILSTGGGGSFTKSGSGTVILSNTASSFTGGTTVTDGLLQTTTSLPGNILDNASVDFEQAPNSTGTFSGQISGTGNVTINAAGNTGKVVLANAANNWSGGTTVAAGTLYINNLTGVPGNITVNTPGALTFDQTADGTFSNQILGTGTVNKIGAATLTYGVNELAFSGTTRVKQGKLVLDHILGGDAIIEIDGKLSGNGSTLGNLTVKDHATISPGNDDIGIFTVDGNYRQSGHTKYKVYAVVQPNLTLVPSLIDVLGKATIEIPNPFSDNSQALSDLLSFGPHVEVHVAPTGQLPLGTVVSSTILEAAGGLTGIFTGVTSDYPLLTAFLSYDANNVTLNLINTLAVIPVTYNERQIGTQLQLITDPTAIEDAILVGTTSLPVGEALQVLDEMSGEQYTSTLLTAEFANRQFIRRLYDPLRLIISTPQCLADTCCDEAPLRLDTWVEGSGHQAYLQSGFNAHEVRISGYEVSVGAQMTFNTNFTMGAAFSYEMDHLHYDVGGSGRSNINLGGLYGLYRPNDFYVLGDFIFGYSADRVTRRIDIGALHFAPHSKPKVFQSGYYVEAGKDYLWKFLLVQPFVGFEGGYYRFDRIVEENGDPLNLTIAKKSVSPAYTRLGLHLTTHNRPCGWSFGLDLSWQYRLTAPGTNIDEQFQSFGTPFTLKGLKVQRNCFEVAANFSTALCDNWQLFGEVSGQSWANAVSYSFMGGLSASW